jgi:protein TonB
LAAVYDPSQNLGSTEVVPVSGAVDAETLDQPLTALSRLPPVYPVGAKRRGIEGWVRLRFVVDPRGEVREVSVIEAKPKGVFEDSVLRSVRSWRFKPGTVNGHPVSARAETTVRFDLE